MKPMGVSHVNTEQLPTASGMLRGWTTQTSQCGLSPTIPPIESCGRLHLRRSGRCISMWEWWSILPFAIAFITSMEAGILESNLVSGAVPTVHRCSTSIVTPPSSTPYDHFVLLLLLSSACLSQKHPLSSNVRMGLVLSKPNLSSSRETLSSNTTNALMSNDRLGRVGDDAFPPPVRVVMAQCQRSDGWIALRSYW